MKEKLQTILSNKINSSAQDEGLIIWKDELNHFLVDFRSSQILKNLRAQKESMLVKKWKSLHLPWGQFLTVLFYLAPASYYFLSGYGLSGDEHFYGTVFLFYMAALTLILATKTQRIFMRIKEFLYLRANHDQIFDRPVEPEELIDFWKHRARNFLDEKEVTLRNQATDIDSSIREVEKTRNELIHNGDPRLETAIQKLEEKTNELSERRQSSLDNSVKIALLRSRLQEKILKLENTIEEFRHIQSQREQVGVLLKRANEILDDSDQFSDQLLENEQDLASELYALTNFIQEELQLSKDYLQSQIAFEKEE